jgi:signal transduction histidine kinase
MPGKILSCLVSGCDRMNGICLAARAETEGSANISPSESAPEPQVDMNSTEHHLRCQRIFPAGFRAHLLWILGRAAICTIVFGLFFWWFAGHGKLSELWGYMLVSLVFSYVYCPLFGLSMPYLAPSIGRLHSPIKWVIFVVTIVGLAAAGDLLITRILLALRMIPPGTYWATYVGNIQLAAVISLIFCFIFVGYFHLRARLERTELELRTQELEKERALKLASEAQLASLESRLHPHFLFNTLNSISALTQEDPAKAEKLIQRLSALLRFSLDANSRRLAPLEQEVKIVRDYLEIEKARLGERLSCSIDVPPELLPLEVPPLILELLVENSIKHAIAPRRAGSELRITARAEGEQLLLEVWDDGPGFTLEDAAGGHGLDNLQGRLATLFGERANLNVEERDQGTAVIIHLPQIRPAVMAQS